VILLDEPMTQLDINQRWFLRKELKIIQKYIKNTMIYVTHDQHEALSFAEKIVVMKDGLVLQEGDPITLYNHPINPFVGWFVGNPGMNIFKCLIEGNRINCNDFEIEIPKEIRKKIENLEGEFHLGIRAEYVKCSKKEKQRYFLTKLSAIENMGSYKILTLNAGNTVIKSIVTRETDVYEGQNIWTNFTEEAEKLKIFKNGKLVL
jgi:glycerol transport system ATP-binding protein